MKPKSLNSSEIALILSNLKSPCHRTLFILANRTGLRISELLSLKVKDVRQYGHIRESVTVERKNVKGKFASRTIPLHSEAKRALESFVNLNAHDECKLFELTRQHAWRVIKGAAERAEIAGNVSTGSTRKGFAQRIFEVLGKDIVGVQRALGHRTLHATHHYLSCDQQAVDTAILST